MLRSFRLPLVSGLFLHIFCIFLRFSCRISYKLTKKVRLYRLTSNEIAAGLKDRPKRALFLTMNLFSPVNF